MMNINHKNAAKTARNRNLGNKKRKMTLRTHAVQEETKDSEFDDADFDAWYDAGRENAVGNVNESNLITEEDFDVHHTPLTASKSLFELLDRHATDRDDLFERVAKGVHDQQTWRTGVKNAYLNGRRFGSKPNSNYTDGEKEAFNLGATHRKDAHATKIDLVAALTGNGYNKKESIDLLDNAENLHSPFGLYSDTMVDTAKEAHGKLVRGMKSNQPKKNTNLKEDTMPNNYNAQTLSARGDAASVGQMYPHHDNVDAVGENVLEVENPRDHYEFARNHQAVLKKHEIEAGVHVKVVAGYVKLQNPDIGRETIQNNLNAAYRSGRNDQKFDDVAGSNYSSELVRMHDLGKSHREEANEHQKNTVRQMADAGYDPKKSKMLLNMLHDHLASCEEQKRLGLRDPKAPCVFHDKYASRKKMILNVPSNLPPDVQYVAPEKFQRLMDDLAAGRINNVNESNLITRRRKSPAFVRESNMPNNYNAQTLSARGDAASVGQMYPFPDNVDAGRVTQQNTLPNSPSIQTSLPPGIAQKLSEIEAQMAAINALAQNTQANMASIAAKLPPQAGQPDDIDGEGNVAAGRATNQGMYPGPNQTLTEDFGGAKDRRARQEYLKRNTRKGSIRR